MNKYFRKVGYLIENFWYFQISTRINPCHKSVRKAIPRWWVDADSLIEDVVFQTLIDFWENEKGEEHLRYQFSSNENTSFQDANYKKGVMAAKTSRKRAYLSLKAAYEWAKVRKEKHEASRSYESMEEYRKLDTKYLIAIIRYRGALWT